MADERHVKAEDSAASAGPAGETAADDPASTSAAPEGQKEERPKEIGGRDGPDPTRYGDWEKDGRCIDF